MTLSLDSNVLIDLVNGSSKAVRVNYDNAAMAGEQMAICSVAAHEVIFGASVSARPRIQIASAHGLFEALSVVDWTREDAMVAAELRADLRRRSLPIGGFDMLIAGQALNRGWTLVTANTREFNRVEGLQVEDWTKG